jgi:di/tricarboxylate transporter
MNSTYMGDVALAQYQRVLGFFKETLQIVFSIVLLALFLSIMFGDNKRGLHDKFGKTSIVDLKTYQTLENYEALVEPKSTPTKTKIENKIPINLIKENDKAK